MQLGLHGRLAPDLLDVALDGVLDPRAGPRAEPIALQQPAPLARSHLAPELVQPRLGIRQLPLSNATQNPNGTVTFDCGSVQKLSAFLKDDVQQLSNNSQMDMIQLQSQMNNLNQVMQTATSVMQKASDTKDKILQNIH